MTSESADRTICLEDEVCGFVLGAHFHSEWDGYLVLLSYLASVAGAFTLLRVVAHLRICKARRWSWFLVAVGGLAFGILCIWNVHRVGMVAMRHYATSVDGTVVQVQGDYSLDLTLCSGAIACFAGIAAIYVTAGRNECLVEVNSALFARIAVSGGIVGSAGCAMLFLATQAMMGPIELHWNAGVMLLTFLASFASTVIIFLILMMSPAHPFIHACASLVMGVVSCMHFSGAHVVTFKLKAATTDGGSSMSGMAIVVVSLLINAVLSALVQCYAEAQCTLYQRIHTNSTVEMQKSIDLVMKIADALVNYDLDLAELLLAARAGSQRAFGMFEPLKLLQPLKLLLRNLTVYRAFLPNALFDRNATAAQVPNEALRDHLKSAESSVQHIQEAIARMRDPGYSLAQFHHNMISAYPELKLYLIGAHVTSGHTGGEEYQRTLGALYTVFAFMRLDIDGKNLVAYGVDETGRVRMKPAEGDDAAVTEKKTKFLRTMDWQKITDLMIRAGILERDVNGELALVSERAIGMLSLTAIHDIMKNSSILPEVQPQHAPYNGYAEGDVITDHDLALAYILEHYPVLLPSYRLLTPAQRAPVLFTQAKMSFNNGWLVQGEAPPGALFTQFKAAIQQGRASESDVSFYFVHWLTDIAGAETFEGRSWPGAEKLTLKLPSHVLEAFLHSYKYVEQLAKESEVHVMEAYLRSRMQELSLKIPRELSGCRVAAMRLCLMAQGFEQAMIGALEVMADIMPKELEVLAVELARTACRDQFRDCPRPLQNGLKGPAFLVYYAPALIQQAGKGNLVSVLGVLAAIFKAARELFPLNPCMAEQSCTIRIDAMKALEHSDLAEHGPWLLKQTSSTTAEAFSSMGRSRSMVMDREASASAGAITTIQLPFGARKDSTPRQVRAACKEATFFSPTPVI